MSTSILYHSFGIRGYKYLKSEFRNGATYFHIEKSSSKQYCSVCQSRNVIRKGCTIRKLKTLPVGDRRVYLICYLHRLFCKSCGALRLEPLIISHRKKHWTKSLGRYILGLLEKCTIQDVADHLGMSWDTVKEIHKWALQKKFKKIPLAELQYLSIDEIAVRKGHNYLTVVIDLISGRVVWVCEGRTKESLAVFLKKLKRSKAPIKAIAMDMWPAYISAVKDAYGEGVIVFDHYHIIAELNRALDRLRIQEASNADQDTAAVYKGSRYLLLRGGETLGVNPEAKAKLTRLLELNTRLNTAYILKEELRQLWSRCHIGKLARMYLESWIEEVRTTDIKPLIEFSRLLTRHLEGIVNYFNHPITTAKSEGINNKIKVLKRRAYGFRDQEYFKLRIYNLHNSRYSLVG